MAISSNSNRSPSPNSSRTNPNSRTQESSCIRKSFSGDPFTRPSIVAYPRSFNPVTPANSPADFSQRNSGHREGLASLPISEEQKENGKDQNLKPARVRSPVVSTGTKSFMAPTISAASKINPSPRKKVLTERNEAVRTSFSAGKSPLPEEVSSKLETIFNSKVHPESTKKPNATLVSPAPVVLKSDANPKSEIVNSGVTTETPLESPAPVVLKNDANPKSEFVNSEVTTETPLVSPAPVVFAETRIADSRCNNADLGSEVKRSLSPSPALVPLEVDPSLPHDPKKNYLSPRPQFLRYKPNPRIDDYLNKKQGFDPGEGKQLLEHFSSESSSETKITEESQSPNPKKECEDVGSSEMASEEENENHFSEHELNTGQNRNDELPMNETQKLPFGRSKSIPLLLILVVACLCFPVTDTPINYPSQTFSRFDSPAKITELAKTKIDVLSHDVMLWSLNSVSYLSKLISIPNRLEQIVPLEFVNSTTPDREYLADQCGTVDYGDNQTERWQGDETIENVVEETAEMQTNVEFGEQPQLEFLDKGDFVSATDIEPTNTEVAEKCSNVEIEEKPLLPQVLDVESDISEVDSLGENDADSLTNIEPTNAEPKSLVPDFLHGSSRGLEPPKSSLQGSTYRSTEQNVLGISLVVLALLVAALLFLKQNKAPAPKVAVPVEQLVAKKKPSSVSASSGHLNQEMTPLLMWPAEVEKVGESCPSETSSSSQGSLNCGKRKASDRANEVQSHGRKPRRSAKRESLASSSEFSAGSPSYGSFTTYEKFQSKHVSGDEGAVTPVRRSSRIRNQITSP